LVGGRRADFNEQEKKRRERADYAQRVEDKKKKKLPGSKKSLAFLSKSLETGEKGKGL